MSDRDDGEPPAFDVQLARPATDEAKASFGLQVAVEVAQRHQRASSETTVNSSRRPA